MNRVAKPAGTSWLNPVLTGLLLFMFGGWGWSPNAAAAPKPGAVKTVDLGGGVRIDFVWCPPGEFMMGSPASETGRGDAEIQHRVTISRGFYLGKYEVTQAQWERVIGSNPSNFKTAGSNAPVETVNWDDCQAFCRKAGSGMRLPTEAEWEYACRAGTTGAYAGDLARMAWCSDNTTTHPVGQKAPNAWGLCDMHGNVWEWCSDWYGPYPAGAATDPQGAQTGSNREIRGGSWGSDAGACRSANRNDLAPSYRCNILGFRVVFVPPGE